MTLSITTNDTQHNDTQCWVLLRRMAFVLNVTNEQIMLLYWVPFCWVLLCRVLLCWVLLYRVLLCWVLLCWVLLCPVLLCWVLRRPWPGYLRSLQTELVCKDRIYFTSNSDTLFRQGAASFGRTSFIPKFSRKNFLRGK
jgi:hypothetical protein